MKNGNDIDGTDIREFLGKNQEGVHSLGSIVAKRESPSLAQNT